MIGLSTSLYKKRSLPISVLSLLLLFALVAGSCNKDLKELNKGDFPLALSADKSKIVLEQKNDAADGVVFNWTSGTNKGTGAAITYLLKIDKQGNSFTKAQTEELGKAGLSKKYSVKDLNNLLLTKWSLTPGTEATLEARVYATVIDHPELSDSSEVLVIKVKSYKPVSETLYLLGDATPKGWNAGEATKMDLQPDQAGKFAWNGPLTPGDMKLITTLGQFLPSYNKGADDNHIVFREADADPDNKFTITKAGMYDVVVNLIDLTISITESAEAPYKRLWMLGDAIPTGWNIDNPAEMRVDSSNLFIFTYNEVLQAGEFKIPVATGNFGTDYYMPLVNNQPLTETGVHLVFGGTPDYKWKVTTPGPYKIKLDLQANTIKITPFTPFTQIWMVGDATPTGWNIDSPTPLTVDPSDPNVFTWTGTLNIGEFKLPVETGDWGGDFFMPVLNASGPGSTQMKLVPGGSPDFKWKITQAGNYKVTINQLYETISIQKQ